MWGDRENFVASGHKSRAAEWGGNPTRRRGVSVRLRSGREAGLETEDVLEKRFPRSKITIAVGLAWAGDDG